MDAMESKTELLSPVAGPSHEIRSHSPSRQNQSTKSPRKSTSESETETPDKKTKSPSKKHLSPDKKRKAETDEEMKAKKAKQEEERLKMQCVLS